MEQTSYVPDSGSVTVIMDLSKRDSRTMQNVPDSSSTTANAQVGHREAMQLPTWQRQCDSQHGPVEAGQQNNAERTWQQQYDS